MRIILLALLTLAGFSVFARPDSPFVIRGFCIVPPSVAEHQRFLNFNESDLVLRKADTLILRVDFNNQFLSHPELRDLNVLSQQRVKAQVKLCKGVVSISSCKLATVKVPYLTFSCN